MNIYPVKNLYDALYQILNDAGFRTYSDVVKWVARNGSDSLSSFQHSWAVDLLSIIEHLFDQVIALHRDTDGPTLIHEDIAPRSIFSQVNPYELGGRYGCLFPGRVLFIGSVIVTYEDADEICVPLQLICQILTLKPLLERGMALLLPSRTVDKSGYNRVRKHSYYHRILPTHTLITTNFFSQDDCQQIPDDLSADESAACRILQTPSICGDSLESAVETAVSNWEDYDRYCRLQSKFLRTAPVSDDAVRDWLRELEDRAANLRTTLERKRQILSRKGVECFVGGLISAAPLLVAGFPPEATIYLRSLIGGKTLYDAFQWFGEWRGLQKQLKDGMPWALLKPSAS